MFDINPNQKLLLTRWSAALKSGNYKQCSKQLCNVGENSYCCLGVLCEVAGISKNDQGYYDQSLFIPPDSIYTREDGTVGCLDAQTSVSLSDPFFRWSGTPKFVDWLNAGVDVHDFGAEGNNRLLHPAALNDIFEQSFEQIAALLDAYLILVEIRNS